jgi:hypothetical protein
MRASRWFFEQCGLDPYGREPGTVPAKPKSARILAKLATAYERAEVARDHMIDEYYELCPDKDYECPEYEAIRRRLREAQRRLRMVAKVSMPPSSGLMPQPCPATSPPQTKWTSRRSLGAVRKRPTTGSLEMLTCDRSRNLMR